MDGSTLIFLSYSHSDTKRSTALRAELRRRRFDAVFIDFDPLDGIPPGRNWETELYRGLRRCDIVVAMDSPEWRESRWCFAEMALARSLGKTIILVRPSEFSAPVTGAAELVRDGQMFMLSGDIATDAEPLFIELQRLGLGALRQFRWDPSRSPYPGLSPLDEADAGVFFGRAADIRAVADLVERCAKYGEKAIVLLIGPSGSGKSSLLRAGVVPQLRLRAGWHVIGPRIAAADPRLPLNAVATLPAGQRALFAIDQIDEALTDPGTTAGLVDSLAELVRAHAGHALVLGTLRADSLALFNEALGDLSRACESVVVGPLRRHDYRDIIEQPATAAGVSIDPRLVDALIADVVSSGDRSTASSMTRGTEDVVGGTVATDALPLLAVTLRQMWDRRSALAMTHASYVSLGGMAGVIARTADAVMMASSFDADAEAALRDAFLGMVRIDRDGRLSRKPLLLAAVQPRIRGLLTRFESEGLLVTSATPGCVELAHEALIRNWPVLAAWVDAARGDLVRLERFDAALVRWQQQPAALLEGIDLVDAEALIARGHPALKAAAAVRLVQASRLKRDEAQVREQQRQQAIRVSESLRLATEARQSADREPETAMRVAWEAALWDRNEMSDSVFRETVAQMPAPVLRLHEGGRHDLEKIGCGSDGAQSWFYAAGGNGSHRFSSDEHAAWIATWRDDGVRIGRFGIAGDGTWDVAPAPSGRRLIVARDGRLSLLDLAGRVLFTAVLPDWNTKAHSDPECRLVVSGSIGLVQHGRHAWVFEIGGDAGDLHIVHVLQWADDPDGDDRDERLHGAYSRIVDVALDADRRRALSNATDSAKCWTLDGSLLATLPRPDSSEFASAQFLGDRVVTGSLRGTGQIWSDGGELITTFKSLTGVDLFIPAIDSRGEHFVTASNDADHALEVWDVNGQRPAHLAAHHEHYWCAAFSPDGRLVAAGCADGTVRIWEWRKERLAAHLHGHTGTVHRVAFNRDGTLLFSGSHDGSARLWRLADPILPTLRAHEGGLREMSRSDGRLVTSGQADDTTLLWSRNDDEPVALQGIALSRPAAGAPHLMLTRDADEAVRLWDWETESGRPLCRCTIPRESQRGRTRAVRISPDGTRFVLTSDEPGPEGAALWTADGDRLATLIGMSAPRHESDRLLVVGTGFQRNTGSIVTGAQNGTVWIWSRDGEPATRFVADTGSPDALLSLNVDPRGEFIVTGVRNGIGFWTWSGHEIRTLQPAGYKVFRVEIAPEGSRLLTISDNPNGSPSYHAELWDRDGERLARLDSPNVSVNSETAFDISGRYFLLRSGSDLRIFDMDGELLGVLAAARGVHVSAVSVSSDGDLVGAQFSDGVIRIWSIDERRRTMIVTVGSEGPFAFSADGRRLLVAMPSGSIEQHALDIADLYIGAAARLDRSFNADEIRRFAIREPVKLDLARYGRR